ncbi:MAG: chorismate synthase [Candidatus Omnitrophica bacterium]|nr:chorismate synthase [Candidatus Omnitrophota bacterium]MBU4487854.1 chorismate synthase [Candidatus Omnitrophota bacterium]MCG2704637.1 chorismate synthase [Candidatus Omnitrophota bacterium]
MLRYLTAGESHGKALLAILEGMPSGLKIPADFINNELKKRQSGYGRGERMKIEADKAEILSGLRNGETIGSPISLLIKNADARIDELPKIHSPRPGHADLAGAMKYGRRDMRDILERSSARETAARVALGAVCKIFLSEFDIDIFSHVIHIGGIDAHTSGQTLAEVKNTASGSILRCADKAAEKLMCEEIDKASSAGDTLGGIFEVVITGQPPGLGSHVQWDRKLDGRLAMGVMSIQAIKGVEIGAGFSLAKRMGSKSHDEIIYKDGRFRRSTNNAGGIEGGITNGEPVVIRAAMKPISTLKNPLKSVDIITKEVTSAALERSDICAVPSASVVAEGVCAFEIAGAFLEKFGSDALGEITKNYQNYIKMLEKF